MQTPEALDKKLQRELGWRKKELFVMAEQIRDAEQEVLNTAIRAGIVLLYAHWEGFVKKAARAYLEFVSKNIYKHRLRYLDLSQGLLAFILQHHLLEKWQQTEKNWGIPVYMTDFFLTRLSEPAQLPDVKNAAMLNTWKLEWDNFYEIMVMLGLDFSSYQSRTTKNLLNRRLFQNRCVVAHGDRHFPDGLDKSRYLDVQSEVIALMEAVHQQIYQAAVQKAYLDTSLAVMSQMRFSSS